MGFGKGNGNLAKYLKIKGLKKEESKAYFELEGKQLDDDYFEGDLIQIENASYEFEGKTRPTIKFRFYDNGEIYQLDISFNIISRNIVNSLSSQDKLGKIKLSLYINSKGYKCVGVTNNGAQAKWKLDYTGQQALTGKILDSDGEFISTDYKKLDRYYMDQVEAMKARITKRDEDVEKDIKQTMEDDLALDEEFGAEPKKTMKEVIKSKQPVDSDEMPF